MATRNNIEIAAGKESRVKTAAWIVTGALFAGTAHGSSAPPSADRDAYFASLHDGRFAAAVETNAGGRDDAERRFFAAFITYWRLIFDDENARLRALLDHQLASVISAATGDDGQAALWAGNGHLLLAQLRAWEKRPMAAAFEAKKAKKALEAAVRGGAEAADAYFGLGTYNYMADALPSYVKGLRALLFLPPGNRKRGLEQLQGAAEGSRHFALEARVLLVTIYANRHERQYARAMEHRDLLVAQAPDTIAGLYASARLDISLGRNQAAIATLARAAERATRLRDVDPVVLRSIDLLRARAEFGALRPDLARATSRSALASGAGLSASIRDDLTQIATASENLAQGIDWSAIPAEPSAEAAARIAALADATPDRPVLALIAGDTNLRAGRPDEAIAWLDRASSASLPPPVRAGCQLRQGQASDLMGQRERALEFYRRAAETPGFAAKDAAYFYQQSPFRAGA
jgi:predicted Zn-dependent protease